MDPRNEISVLNLRKDYDEALLRRFYAELMVPCFGTFEVRFR